MLELSVALSDHAALVACVTIPEDCLLSEPSNVARMWLEKELITSKKAAKSEMGSLHGDRLAIAIVTTLVAVNLIVFLG